MQMALLELCCAGELRNRVEDGGDGGAKRYLYGNCEGKICEEEPLTWQVKGDNY